MMLVLFLPFSPNPGFPVFCNGFVVLVFISLDPGVSRNSANS
jgi:hypothetical protein